jgi:hypothetical protein
MFRFLCCTFLVGCGGAKQVGEGPSFDTETTTPSYTENEPAHEFEGYLANAKPSGCDGSYVFPFDTEAGWWDVARLSSEHRDVEVDQIEYSLADETESDSAAENGCRLIDHRVRVFVDGHEPPDDPTFIFEELITGLNRDDLDDGERVKITLDIDPIAIAADESLYIMVETPVDLVTGARICATSCTKGNVEQDRNFQSGAPDAPYNWIELAAFGMDDTLFAFWARIVE